ncbi:MAG: Ig-like domain-containing protein [Tannerellaceae bacterium]|jgi:uncharacterized protein YjdB|nr:Ig-like domain-containing protein [Tannerellaceae bacterium]
MKKRVLQTALCLLVWSGIAHAQSPYIYRVYDYMPAPGQFVNEMPAYRPGDTQEVMNRKVEAEIAGANHNVGMITLGGYGGYLVFGFDHFVENVPGKYDFRILGNAFYANANPSDEASPEGGSCEPGIVMVARDANGNGLPDDPWYELAGSEYYRSHTVKGYHITYYRPDEDKPRTPHPSNPYLNDIEYVRWTTNGHGNGYLYRNVYHNQAYYPLWAAGETLEFAGTKLADNYVDESGRGVYYVQYAYHWGYADNQPNADNRSAFNIEWAVDAAGNRVSLPGIDFVKVYTGVNQYCGWLGETSTEVSGAEDLHLTGQDADAPVFVNGISLDRSAASLTAGQTLTLSATLAPEGAANRTITWKSSAPAIASVASGTVTAHAPGTTVIRAIANDGYYVAECRITVTNGDGDPVDPAPDPDPEPGDGSGTVTGVTLSHAQIILRPGGMTTLYATVLPADAVNREVQWSSSDTGVAEVTVSGLVFAVAQGTATITATTTEGGYRASCLVTVSDSTPDAAFSPPLSPHVGYASGSLRLIALDGYNCTLYNLAGRVLQTFRPTSPDEYRPITLPSGVYILAARKQGVQETFKIVL